MTAQQAAGGETTHPTRELIGAIVRFAGDSGDGMQVTGSQFTVTAALAGNDLATFPDFPAEIRAPAGTLYGVSGFQINFAARDVFTPGDAPDVLVAMNPAALKTNLPELKPGGLLVVNEDAFTPQNLKKAGYDRNPIDDGSLSAFRVLSIPITKLTVNAVKESGLGTKDANRCKNFWTLGLMYWIYNRPLDATLRWLERKYKKRPEIIAANGMALKAGHAYGETLEISYERYEVPAAAVKPGLYRNISGNQAAAWGLLAGAERAGLELVLGSYPITPASTILHELSALRQYGATTLQAEDEIAAACIAIGASYAGAIGVCTTSGPGMALKMEAIGLAVAVELPLVVVDIQRAGPSTGMPTKTEQADLHQAIFGRNSEAPVAVIAAYSPGHCFHMAYEAVRLAIQFMTPVILLTDGYLANGAEPWPIPKIADLPPIDPKFRKDPEGFHPFLRNPETLARNWAIPGTPGLRHRIGGIEKAYDSGHISYDPQNHQKMTDVRAAKIAKIAEHVPEQTTAVGPDSGKLLVLGWGSTYGAIHEAVTDSRARGLEVSHAHLSYLNPLPRNLGDLLARFDRVLIPELNMGQLAQIIRGRYLVPAESYPKVEGQPFLIEELTTRIRQMLES